MQLALDQDDLKRLDNLNSQVQRINGYMLQLLDDSKTGTANPKYLQTLVEMISKTAEELKEEADVLEDHFWVDAHSLTYTSMYQEELKNQDAKDKENSTTCEKLHAHANERKKCIKKYHKSNAKSLDRKINQRKRDLQRSSDRLQKLLI